MGRGLSSLQHCILSYLLDYTEWIEENQLESTLFWRRDGVPWQPSKLFKNESGEYTPAMRAAISKSVCRLEERGLVMRQNVMSGVPGLGGKVRKSQEDPAPIRSDHLLLTDAGRLTANKSRSEFVSQ